MAWNDEKKQEVIKEYTRIMAEDFDTDEQRAENTTEVVAQLAEQYGETVNGTRMILTRAGVYVTKAPAKKATTAKGGTARVSKADAIQSLTNAIAAIDPALVNSEILEKLTGKAAAYFTEVLNAVQE